MREARGLASPRPPRRNFEPAGFDETSELLPSLAALHKGPGSRPSAGKGRGRSSSLLERTVRHPAPSHRQLKKEGALGAGTVVSVGVGCETRGGKRHRKVSGR